jgi:hypothetical protein
MESISALHPQSSTTTTQWNYSSAVAVLFTFVVSLCTIAAFCMAACSLMPTIKGEEFARWDAEKEFRAWCQNEVVSLHEMLWRGIGYGNILIIQTRTPIEA